MMAESLTFALAEHMPRSEAKKVVRESVEETLQSQKTLLEVVKGKIELALDWERLEEKNYLGSIQTFIDHLLQEAEDK